jgi:hypothetical protein
MLHLNMKDYVFTLAKATSTLAKNEMNSMLNKLTVWSEERSVGVLMRYKQDSQIQFPVQWVVGALCPGCEATQMIKLKMAYWFLLHNFYSGATAVFPLAKFSEYIVTC